MGLRGWKRRGSAAYIEICDRNNALQLSGNATIERDAMPLSVAFALFTLVMVLIVFLVVRRARGPWFALAAGGLAFVGMFALFLGMLMFITSSMP
jgi:hypothetical protein